MIALRADDDVDCRCTPDDLFALGLGHATRNRDHHSAPFPGRRLFERAHAAKFGIDFFRRLLADMAGMENDEIGIRHACRLDKTFGRERVRHTMRIVDVHLAAKGFDVDFARLGDSDRHRCRWSEAYVSQLSRLTNFCHLRGWPLVHVLAGLALKGNGRIGSMMVSINRKSVRAFPRWMRAPILSWAILSLVQGGTAAQMVAEFYRGKTIKMVISTTAGGEYDLWARLIVRHMGKHLPGNPNLIAVNMPGAGGIAAANHLINVAEQDGTVIGMIGRNLPYQALVQQKGILFDPVKFHWLGSPDVSNRVCVAIDGAAVQKASDLLQRELLVGGAGAGTAVSTTPVLRS